MPIRNAEKHLPQCLNSIIMQSFSQWELLAINDHSTDKTANILNQFAAKDVRIKVYSNKGKGIIHALQTAYSYSQGKYISRMDADDLMPKDKLQKMHSAILENPNSLITGKVHYIADQFLYEGYIKYQKWLNDLVDKNSHYREIYKECVVASPCWLISRSQFEICSAFSSSRYPEDYDLCFRFYANNIPIVALQDKLHVWRDHRARTSRNDSNYSNNAFLDLKMHYFIQIDYCKEKQLVLWGAGKKAKKVAKILLNKKIDFIWACNNKNKIGHNVYGKIIGDVELIFDNNKQYQAILCVANSDAQIEINHFLNSTNNIESFWFC